MNILMVTMSLGIGGVETHITELTKELIRRGHRVTVASAGGVYVPEITASGASHVTLPLAGRSPIGLAQAYFGLRRLIKSGGVPAEGERKPLAKRFFQRRPPADRPGGFP